MWSPSRFASILNADHSAFTLQFVGSHFNVNNLHNPMSENIWTPKGVSTTPFSARNANTNYMHNCNNVRTISYNIIGLGSVINILQFTFLHEHPRLTKVSKFMEIVADLKGTEDTHIHA